MKKFESITEWQLLFYAREAIRNEISKLSVAIDSGSVKQSLRRSTKLLSIYKTQFDEITSRLHELNYSDAYED